MEEFISHKPPYLANLNSNRKVESKEEYDIANVFSEVYVIYSDWLKEAGREQDAEKSLSRSGELKAAIENYPGEEVPPSGN